MNHSTQHPDEYAAFTTPTNTPAAEDTQAPHAHHGARQHWLMWLMCLPMVGGWTNGPGTVEAEQDPRIAWFEAEDSEGVVAYVAGWLEAQGSGERGQ